MTSKSGAAIRYSNLIQRDPVTWLYPVTEPLHSYRLPVSGGHEIYVEECGAPDGIPIAFLHGGPGGGIEAGHRSFFNPERFRIFLFDQRGSGKSTPHAGLEHNTVWDLVSDMELIRSKAGIEKWHLFGGSWGSTLALTYAISHPKRVASLILRGIFMIRKEEINWFYQDGASKIFPDAWQDFATVIPEAERGDIVSAYYKRLTSADPKVRIPAAKAWSLWEGQTTKLYTPRSELSKYVHDQFAEAFARIECHYFINRGFYDADDYILKNAQVLREIPGTIIHGRYDMCCPVKNAWDLHQAWPEAQLQIIPDAGHSAFEPAISRALIAATDRLAESYKR